MDEGKSGNSSLLAFLAVFGSALPFIAYMAWDQALAFDRCANIFVRPGQCITSGMAFAGGGVFLMVMGGAFLFSAMPGRGNTHNPLAVLTCVLMGLSLAASGSAMIYGGLSIA